MNNPDPIYLDYAATTPVDPRVLEAMQPYFYRFFGNPSSVHRFGQQAEAALEDARESLAKSLNCQADEIVFTSCGSESDNLALRGGAMAARKLHAANHILISPIEHPAISNTAKQLAELYGFELETLPVNEFGQVLPAEVASRLRPNTAIVSVMHANNEIGTINPIAEIGMICQERGVLFHTDSVQAAAYLPVDAQALHVDLLSLGAHKFYGPKGVGALYVRKGTALIPSQTGGGQENRIRAGTQNIPYIVGMAKAFELAQIEREERIKALLPLRDRLIGCILEAVPGSRLTGHPSQRLPNHASFVLNQVDGNALVALLDILGFACSSGSACKTGNPEPSEVLLALGISRQWALGSLRITLGKSSTPEQIDALIDALPLAVEKCRKRE